MSGLLVSAQNEWNAQRKQIESLNYNCDNIKKAITTYIERGNEINKRLDWVSQHDYLKDYKEAQQRTGTESAYLSSCQWFIDDPKFVEWYGSGQTHVLWLKGTIGTGKTAVMCRAMNDVQHYLETGKLNGSFAMFFFRKASTSNAIDVNCCLRSLVRQLCWDDVASMLHPAVEREYQDCERRHRLNSSLTTADSLNLLVEILAGRETYVMIDGIDECDGAPELMEMVRKLFRETQKLCGASGNVLKRPSGLHIMLSGRSDSPVLSEYFEKCSIIETGPLVSSDDHDFFVETEIEEIRLTKPMSDFVRSDRNFTGRLERILKRDGRGLFRWTEIQLSFYSQTEFIGDDDIEEELDKLEKRMTSEELNKRKGEVLNCEYDRLLNRLKRCKVNFERAIKVLKFLASSSKNLSSGDLACAITLDEAGTDRSKVTEKLISQILVGFVIEEIRLRCPESRLKSFMKLGHASVLEFLLTSPNIPGGFSVQSQNFQAALLCFNSTSMELSSPNPTAKEPPWFTKYSMFWWAEHCTRALMDHMDENLLDSICNFIASHPYLDWERVLGREWLGRVLLRFDSGAVTLLRTSENKSPRSIHYITDYASQTEPANYQSRIKSYFACARLARLGIPSAQTLHYLMELPTVEDIKSTIVEEIQISSAEEAQPDQYSSLTRQARRKYCIPVILFIYRHCMRAGFYDINQHESSRVYGLEFLEEMAGSLSSTMCDFLRTGAWRFEYPWLEEAIKCLLSIAPLLWNDHSSFVKNARKSAKVEGYLTFEVTEDVSHYRLGKHFTKMDHTPRALVYLLWDRIQYQWWIPKYSSTSETSSIGANDKLQGGTRYLEHFLIGEALIAAASVGVAE